MTGEEAKKILNTVLLFGECDCSKEKIEECLKMAIKALEQQPCEDAVSRQALYEWLDGWKEKNKYYHPHTKNEVIPFGEVIDIIQSLPPVTPKPKTDTWSIKEVADALEKHGLIREQEPCEDCISRGWLKTAIHNFYHGLKHIPTEEDIQAYIDAAPSVNSQTKIGRWIAVENEEMETVGYYCSECDLPMETEQRTKFCPNCGAKMESEDEEKCG